MDKKRLLNSENGVQCLLLEFRVHWQITDCDGVLQLLEIYEDDDFVYLVVEYHKYGILLKQIMNFKSLDEK